MAQLLFGSKSLQSGLNMDIEAINCFQIYANISRNRCSNVCDGHNSVHLLQHITGLGHLLLLCIFHFE